MESVLPWLIAAVLLLLLTSVLVRQRWIRWRRRRRIRKRQQKARRGELDAEKLLRKRGLEVLEVQPTTVWQVFLDGDPIDIELQADFLVTAERPDRGLRKQGTRRGDILVAEVKTGNRAPDIRNSRTRRQLLEYKYAYDVDGVLLVDMEAGVLHVVEF